MGAFKESPGFRRSWVCGAGIRGLEVRAVHPRLQSPLKLISPILAAGLVLIAGSRLHAASVLLDVIGRFNVITGNYTAGNETEGAALVHGTYLPQGSSSRFGFNGGQVANDSENVLWLNNGVGNGNGTTLITGSVVSRVAVSPVQFTLNGNAPGSPSISTGSAAWSSALQSVGLTSTADLTGMLASASGQWSALAANSTGTTPGNGSFTFNATPAAIDGHQVAVFHVTSAQLFGGGGFDRLEANFNGAETILVNVSGASITVDKNFTNGFTNNENKILFNFYEATSLTINRNFRGAIYAPFANVVQGGVNFDGSVIAGSLTQSAEIHEKNFDAYLPFTAVPEPSAALLAVLGLGLALRRRR